MTRWGVHDQEGCFGQSAERPMFSERQTHHHSPQSFVLAAESGKERLGVEPRLSTAASARPEFYLAGCWCEVLTGYGSVSAVSLIIATRLPSGHPV